MSSDEDGRTQKRGDARREWLSAAALALLDEEGPGGLTHRTVAQRADVPLSSVAYYYPTKEALVEAALDRLLERELEQFDHFGQRLSGDELPSEAIGEGLADLLLAIVRGRDAPLAQLEALLRAGRQESPSPAACRWIREYRKLAARLLDAAGVPDPEPAARLAVASLFGLVLLELVDPQHDDVLRAVCARLAEGLRPS